MYVQASTYYVGTVGRNRNGARIIGSWQDEELKRKKKKKKNETGLQARRRTETEEARVLEQKILRVRVVE